LFNHVGVDTELLPISISLGIALMAFSNNIKHKLRD